MGTNTNTQTLRNAGLLAGDLPADYETWIDGLDPSAITQLVTLKQTLKNKHDIETVPVRVKEKGISWLPIFAVTKSMPVL